MRAIPIVATVLLITAACGGGGAEPSRVAPRPSTPGPAMDAAPELDRLTCEGLERLLVPGYSSRLELVGAFGDPDEVEVSTQPNRHVPAAIDSLFVVHYPGMTARYLRPEDGEDLPTSLTVERSGYLRYPEIGIGASGDRVRDVLGPPGTAASDRMEYDCGNGASQPVRFQLDEGVVRAVDISFYVD